jgi:hypothetical protein
MSIFCHSLSETAAAAGDALVGLHMAPASVAAAAAGVVVAY